MRHEAGASVRNIEISTGVAMVQSAEVIPINIEDEMRGSYLDYAMSVIIGRAIPDVRDGLKPVHRRILYAMYREGLLSSRRFSKCAGVVGEVLKKYHPHGDMAVYDALVRMAQEWNMRYPLIQGQGNFGCFAGETQVRLADGSTRSFHELVADAAKGITHFTYTVDAQQQMHMAPMCAPRLTKRDTPVVRVTLDNGEQIVCTPDHRFLLRDGSYQEAQTLRPGVSLMPLYSRYYTGSDRDLQGYEEIYNPADDSWVFAHRLADTYNVKAGVYARSAGRVRHHQDFNKLNNDPRNILRMSWAAHRHVHQLQLRVLWQDPQFRQRMRGVLSRLWKNPGFRAKTTVAIGQENRRRWQSAKFRAAQAKAQEKLWADPRFRDRILQKAMEKNILLHGTEAQRAAVTRAQKAWLQHMWQDPQYVAAQRERMRVLSTRLWADAGHRGRMTALARERMRMPQWRAWMSARSRSFWSNEDYRTARSQQSKRQWQDPAYRRVQAAHVSRNGHKTTQSRFLTICQRALALPEGLNAENYDRIRQATGIKGIVRYEQGLSRYYHGDHDALVAASAEHHGRLNHTIIAVEPAGRADVYDLTVDHTHNFALAAGVFVHNSVDGDSAAAYRYTECRLTKLAEELLADIDKETVDFTPNFDAVTEEPTLLPSKVPNLLINGSEGIAVGMAAKIPPHNLTEVVEALLALIKEPTLTVKQLMKYIPGPDFPTGAFIHGRDGIREAYETGRGIIRLRGRALIEPIARGDREQIVVTEIPFQVNKARLIVSIAQLVQNEKLTGIADIRDESDRDGMRIVVELKRGTVAGIVLNQLFKHTALESTFGVIMLSIVNQQPKILSLQAVLQQFIDHRREVVIRRTTFELKEAEHRAHILAGLKIAIENIDEVVALIKKSKSPEMAREGLIKRFDLSEIQAQAILELRLQRLTGLEREKIVAEYAEIMVLIDRLKAILADERLVYELIANELKDLKERFGDARRTQILEMSGEISVEDMIQEEDMAVTVTHRGYIKRNPISIYRAQRRGGQGKIGMSTSDDDFVEQLFVASTHSYLLVFSSSGKLFWLKVHELPQIGRAAKGKAITNLIQMPSDDYLAAILPVREFAEGQFVVMATAQGTIKKTALAQFSRPRTGGIIALGVDAGDRMIAACLTNGHQDILLSTESGQAIRFTESEVREMGRTAHGVRGIRLQPKDRVVSMEVLREKATVLTVTANGYGKRTALEEYRPQGRGGSGLITIKTTDRNGPVVGVIQVSDTDDVMLVSSGGQIIRTKVADISVLGRNTQGVRLFSLGDGERVASVATLAEQEDE